MDAAGDDLGFIDYADAGDDRRRREHRRPCRGVLGGGDGGNPPRLVAFGPLSCPPFAAQGGVGIAKRRVLKEDQGL